jgi:hypothetical protein
MLVFGCKIGFFINEKVLFTYEILFALVELKIGLAWASASKIAPLAEKAGSSKLVYS